MAFSVHAAAGAEQAGAESGAKNGTHTIARLMTHMTPTLKTTTKATAAGKPRAQTAPKNEDRSGQATQPTPSAVKTVLVASYGWPTEAMLPSKRQAARR
jgi:hypothetical protein